jgi:hypothetical protein
MHGLTGGSWKRSGHRATATGKNDLMGNHEAISGPETYRRPTPPRQLSTLHRHGVSAATFHYLEQFSWRRVTRWLLKRHTGINWKMLYRRFLTGRPGRRPEEKGIVLFNPQSVEVTRYRWRAANIPTPWTRTQAPAA